MPFHTQTPQIMNTVLITGGTGLVGTRLSQMLHDKGYRVIHLSRKEQLQAKFPAYRWDINEGFIDPAALDKADHIVHLAGASIIGPRWTKHRKKVIIDSRVNSLKLLAQQLKTLDKLPQSFIAASAVGYYGNTGDKVITEQSPPSQTGFLSETCVRWEVAADDIAAINIRLVKLRIGIVLSTIDGALPKMMISFKANVGTWFGNGQQYYPWIHIDDLASMFIQAIEKKDMRDVYNATAPNPVTNKDFIKTLSKALDKKSLLIATPSLVLRLAMGEMADTILHGNRVIPERMLAENFQFQHPNLEEALRDLILNKK